MFRQLTVEQRLHKAVASLMDMPRYRRMRGTFMIGKRDVVDDIPTACTNGRDEMYGRAFCEAQRDKQLRAVVVHENYHKVLRHLQVWDYLFRQDAQTANMACDHVINLKIEEDIHAGADLMFWDKPKPLLDHRFKGMDAHQVFDILRKEGAGGGQSMDQHDYESAQDMGKEEQEAVAKEVERALRDGERLAGSDGSPDERRFGEMLEPKVDWREALREFVLTTCAGSDFSTWSRPNRRYMGTGWYMPSGVSEQVGDLVVGPDMSGSTAPFLDRILTEIAAVAEMANPSAVDIAYWDTKVCHVEHYEQDEVHDIGSRTTPKGGGGTDVTCLSDWINDRGEQPQAAVVITDGDIYGNWGNWNCPVLWCVVGGSRVVPPFGKVVYVDR